MEKEAIEIRNRIVKEFPYIHASRVPVSTYEAFIELADRDFCGDYGLLIRQLILEHFELIELKKLLYSISPKLELKTDDKQKL